MADPRLRELERAAALGDEAARLRLVRHRIRVGGRDPRDDPRPGDRLQRGEGARRQDLTIMEVARVVDERAKIRVVYLVSGERGRRSLSLSQWRKHAVRWEVDFVAELAGDTPCSNCDGLPHEHEEETRFWASLRRSERKARGKKASDVEERVYGYWLRWWSPVVHLRCPGYRPADRKGDGRTNGDE